MLLFAILVTACNGKAERAEKTGRDDNSLHAASMEETTTQAHLNVDRNRLMAYVTCTPEAMDSMLHAADSIYSMRSTLCLDSLWFDNENYNKELEEKYQDTLTVAVFILMSHDAINAVTSDEANAAFVWHEVARTMMLGFLKKDNDGTAGTDCERILKVAEEVIYRYACGSQGEMNNVARRDIALSAYRLTGLYEQVIDTWPGQETLRLAHDDYNHIVTTLARYRSTITEYYSMLPLQIGVLCKDLMDGKAKSLEFLLAGKGKEGGDEESVISNLREHRFLDDKGTEVSLDDKVVAKMAEESYVN